MKKSTNKELAVWYQNDSAYQYAVARRYRDAGDAWFAVHIQQVAARSAEHAREYAALSA